MLRHKNKALNLFLFSALVVLTIASYRHTIIDEPMDIPARMSAQAKQHILYGDARGGGHKYGVGKPCKSEFPSNWGDEKIIETVSHIAANDNLPWRLEENGYEVVERLIDGIDVRVVTNPQTARIITAYPINVPRNPCPVNDN